MYTYFTREQLSAFANHILNFGLASASYSQKSISPNDIDNWINQNPEIFQPLPPIFAMLEYTHFVIEGHSVPCTIHAVHILRNGTKYDLDILLPDGEKHRLYNVSPALLARPEWNKSELPQQVQLVNKMFDHFKE
jgi:hypothetical protein